LSTILTLETRDVRFPTSRHLEGSDAMNPFPDYSAAYAVLRTSDGVEGHSLVFTVGRGNDVQVAGIKALAMLVVGMQVDDIEPQGTAGQTGDTAMPTARTPSTEINKSEGIDHRNSAGGSGLKEISNFLNH
jgi:L-alanine-DL-glutamate epimerase-like enolase superfamily enzyme